MIAALPVCGKMAFINLAASAPPSSIVLMERAMERGSPARTFLIKSDINERAVSRDRHRSCALENSLSRGAVVLRSSLHFADFCKCCVFRPRGTEYSRGIRDGESGQFASSMQPAG